jgi:large subunit ribosomal protein L4
MAEIVAYNANDESLQSLDLSIDLLKKELNSKAYACSIRALRQNWRQGTVGCKSRGQLAFSNSKPWKQKGTGRARAGSLRSPLWRKGGVIFGPTARSKMFFVNDKDKKIVFNNLFYSFIDNKSIYCCDFDSDSSGPKTKLSFKVLEKMGLSQKGVLLFLPFNDELNSASFRNIPNVTILAFDQPNAFDLSNCDCWMFLKKDLDKFKEMVLRWS